MRISDWSSDVCSSDLQTPRSCQWGGTVGDGMGLGRRRISGGRRIGCRHPDQDFLVQKWILFGHAAGRLAADPAIAVADAGDRLEWNAQPPGRPRGAAVLADVVVPVASGGHCQTYSNRKGVGW